MMKKSEQIILFDSYLSGEMPEDEKPIFEERLTQDAMLHAEFDEYRMLSEEISEAAEYDEFQQKLGEVHRELYPGRQLIFLRPKFLWITGAAASIVLIFLFMNPFDTVRKGKAMQEDHEYHELASEEESTNMVKVDTGSEDGGKLTGINPEKITERELCDSLMAQVPKRPYGTSFMISNNGYFLTSKHLVKNKNIVVLQHRETKKTFEAEVVYRDSLLDFAILKCHDAVAGQFDAVPFKFYRHELNLGDVVFTLGYPKSDIVYTKGDVSSETGFKSDSNYIEISMPANPGFSGAPLLTADGYLAGIITANNSNKQSVTYVLKHDYILEKIEALSKNDSLNIDLHRNYLRKHSQTSGTIKELRPYIFELH